MSKYRSIVIATAFVFAGSTAALASCDGSLGRGWAGGNGKGSYEMAAGAQRCAIPFASFYSNNGNTRTPANEVSLRRAPKSGTITLSSSGIVYTPEAGFTGKDRFCTINRSSKFEGETLSGCITVTVK
ncbi:hypothetical protein CEP88_16965 [Roseobacter denitrificans]|nr:Ig-like domain-containing protein [Roseobacter denitrificans]AVL54122.1 hypothetical protein CEP88_16965 [Roseobacter denitrificans]SFG33729.1 hypothetical protein SAMN05443635_113128 [Roseobacter denitrificans OCh 114]